MLEELINHKPSLSSQIEERKVVLEQPGPIRCEENQSLGVCASLQHLLYARHQLPVLGVVEKQICENQKIEIGFTSRQTRNECLGFGAP